MERVDPRREYPLAGAHVHAVAGIQELLALRLLLLKRLGCRAQARCHRELDGIVPALASRLQRRTSFDLSVTGGHLYLSLGDETLAGELERVALQA